MQEISTWLKPNTARRAVMAALVIVVAVGVWARFYHITDNQFIYYDEGLWLNQSRPFADQYAAQPPTTARDFGNYININFHNSLATAKSLWAFITSMRAFFVGPHDWYFSRVFSAIFGVLTLGLVYFFAKRMFASQWVGFLSVALLSIYPSHVYYSRLALQESFSTFCFILGLFLYVHTRRLHYRTYLSAIVLSLVYFSNYRMIVTPVLIVFAEFFLSFVKKEKIAWAHLITHVATFIFIVIVIGSIDNAANLGITFAWMGHQADLAGGQFDYISLFSHAYYLFALEGLIFGTLFFGNIYLILKKEYARIFPFALSLVVMLMFSLSQEKGVRYLCAVMPLMVISVAVLIEYVYLNKTKGGWRNAVIALVVLMTLTQTQKIIKIAHFKTDYEISVRELQTMSPGAKFISTQNLIQNLYTPKYADVIEARPILKLLTEGRNRGYRYLIIDPQAYISKTDNKERFNLKLAGFLNFIYTKVPPVKVYPHFNKELLERFVLEHNVNLGQSLSFINANKDGKLGALYVYDIDKALAIMSIGMAGKE